MDHVQVRASVSITPNSALHSSRVAKSSTSFGWGIGGNVSSAGWQVTLCDPIRHVSSRSDVATLRTAVHLLLTYLPRKCFFLLVFSPRLMIIHGSLGYTPNARNLRRFICRGTYTFVTNRQTDRPRYLFNNRPYLLQRIAMRPNRSEHC